MEFHLIPHCRLAAAALLVVLFTPLAVSAQDVESADDPFPAVVAEERAAAPEEGMTPASLFRENPAAVFWSVLPFLIASLIAIWFGVERTVVLRRGRVIPKPFVERFLNLLRAGQLDPHSALELCEQNGSPVANIFAYGVRKWGKPSVEVEQAIIDGGERQVAQLRKHLRIINGVATITPLIGLLGTVTALSTTAIGLAIAIPCLILYMYLAGRIDGLVMEMDELAQQVVNLISAEGLASNPPVRPSPRSRIKAAETI
ncbi:MAG: MotA/TolQ/ExbB proton channel family protein [Planctomycetota bacterium]|nr:MotA/TolQ/ExbB proton channel family protein [Planctomycetota bacterium]